MNAIQLRQLLSMLIQETSSYLETEQEEDEELYLALAETMRNLLSRIYELEQSPIEGLQEASKVPQIDKGMASSNIYGFNYDPKSQRLFVKFQGNDGEGQGPIYGYDGIPQVIFDLFQMGAIPARTDGQNKWGKWWKGKVPSAGAAFHTLIKEAGYPYQKVA